MQHITTTNAAPSAAYLLGTVNLVPLTYGGGGTLDGATFTIIGFSGTPRTGTLAAPTGPSDVATQVQAASGGDFTASLTTVGSASFLRITDGTTGDTSSLEADAGTLLALVGLTTGQTSTGSSNADPFPSAIPAAQNGDALNTAAFQVMLTPVAEALGHLKNTKTAAGESNNWGGTQTFADIAVTSRSVTRILPITWVLASGPALPSNNTLVPDNDSASGQVSLPHGQTLTAFKIYIDPASVGALPGALPNIKLAKYAKTAGPLTAVNVVDEDDPSASAGAYNALHSFGATGLSEVIDTENYVYYALFASEPVDDTVIVALEATCTVTSMEQWS
jgi:hypothetical protein